MPGPNPAGYLVGEEAWEVEQTLWVPAAGDRTGPLPWPLSTRNRSVAGEVRWGGHNTALVKCRPARWSGVVRRCWPAVDTSRMNGLVAGSALTVLVVLVGALRRRAARR